jgi:hypothetical protein
MRGQPSAAQTAIKVQPEDWPQMAQMAADAISKINDLRTSA